MNFYIGDPHFGHEAIIRLCNRPFADVDEMDETLINNWNSRVTNGDTVFILDCGCAWGADGRLGCLRLDDMAEFYSEEEV